MTFAPFFVFVLLGLQPHTFMGVCLGASVWGRKSDLPSPCLSWPRLQAPGTGFSFCPGWVGWGQARQEWPGGGHPVLRMMSRLARGSPDARASLGLCLLSQPLLLFMQDWAGARPPGCAVWNQWAESRGPDQPPARLEVISGQWRRDPVHPACSVSIPALDLSVFSAIKRRPFFSSASAPPPTCSASLERSRKGHHRVAREPLGRPRVESSPKCVSPAAAEAHAQMVPILEQDCWAADWTQRSKKGLGTASQKREEQRPKAREKRGKKTSNMEIGGRPWQSSG